MRQGATDQLGLGFRAILCSHGGSRLEQFVPRGTIGQTQLDRYLPSLGQRLGQSTLVRVDDGDRPSPHLLEIFLSDRTSLQALAEEQGDGLGEFDLATKL
ncbi:MAG: hypothetical protein KC910_23135 [Candidatus Eremiobacteraeota bacterium]|nr:hypothetical protein [Candidatus Eremiobacteraeota bacterium]